MTTSSSTPYLRETSEGVRLEIRLQPRAKRSGFLGFFGPARDAVKWGVHSAPVDNAANEELCRSLADVLHQPRKNIVMLSGSKSRRKSVQIKGVTSAEVDALLYALIAS